MSHIREQADVSSSGNPSEPCNSKIPEFPGGPMSDAERRLWRAVLEQAYEDAEMLALDGLPGPEPLECARARRYLRADSPLESGDLKLVCEFANVPADRVFFWARRRFPLEQAIEGNLECGGPACPEPDLEAPAFSTPVTSEL
jgi:hypothetical protein